MKDFSEALQNIKMILFDVDGVLSDGNIYLDDNGKEIKSFYARDGLGLKMIMSHGIICGVITGRNSQIVTHRMTELGMQEIHQGIKDKLAVYEDIRKKYGLTNDECAFVGDDIPDVEVFRLAGIAFAVGDAHISAKESADYITEAYGGRGAVREICDLIMNARGWELFVP